MMNKEEINTDNIKSRVFKDFSVNKYSKVPYYYQVYIYILRKINNDKLKVGDKLPNENRLSELLDVSRVTIRKALNELKQNGIISRDKSIGTFIKHKPDKTYDIEISTFIETADRAQKEISDSKKYNIVDFMSNRVGKIRAEDWRPVIRPTRYKYNIAYGTFKKSEWWYHDLVEQGMKETASAIGCECIILDNMGDRDKAMANAKTVIEEYKNGNIDFFINAQSYEDLNDEISVMLEQARVPACAVDIYCKNFPFFHVDDYKLGFIAGEWLGNYANKHDWHSKNISFIYIDYLEPGRSVRNRRKGTFDGLKSFIKLKENNCHILKIPSASIEESKKIMLEWLDANPDHKDILIAGAVNFFTIGASMALGDSDRENNAVICSTTGSKDDLEELARENSPYKAVICTFPELYGSILIPYAIDYLEGNPVPADFVSYSQVITRDNLARFYPEFFKNDNKY